MEPKCVYSCVGYMAIYRATCKPSYSSLTIILIPIASLCLQVYVSVTRLSQDLVSIKSRLNQICTTQLSML